MSELAPTTDELVAEIRQLIDAAQANADEPRISRMRPGQTHFTLTDPNGNSVIFIKFGPEDEDRALALPREPGSGQGE